MNLNDPGVRLTCRVLYLVVCLVLLLTSAVSMGIVIDWYSNDGDGPGNKYLIQISTALPYLSGEKSNNILSLFGIFLVAAPLIIASVCVSTIDGVRNINKFGYLVLFLLLVSAIFACIGYVGINPEVWGDGHNLKREGLQKVEEWSKTTMRGSIFYIAAILGLKVAS